MLISRFILALLMLAFTIVSTIERTEADVSVYEAGKVVADKDYDDFHIQIKSSHEMVYKLDQKKQLQIIAGDDGAIVDAGKPTVDPKPPASSKTIELEWEANIFKGDTAKWVLGVTEKEENKLITTAFFTPKQSPSDIPTLGWDVQATGDVFFAKWE